MKTRWLVKVYRVENVKEYKDGGRDDIDEQTEDQQKESDFYCQMQGNSLDEISTKMKGRK